MMTAKIASRPSVGLLSPCNIAVEIITYLDADRGECQDQRSVGLAKFDRKTIGVPTTHTADQRITAKSQIKIPSTGDMGGDFVQLASNCEKSRDRCYSNEQRMFSAHGAARLLPVFAFSIASAFADMRASISVRR
jgi:hypothetical protein